MNIFLISYLLLIGIFFLLKQKSFSNLLTFNYFYWLVIVILSSLRLYGMMSYSNFPFIIIFIGMIGMLIGYIFGYKIKNNDFTNAKKYRYSYKEKFIKIICIIDIIFYFIESFRVIQLLNNGINYYYVRRMYQGYEDTRLFISSFEQYFSSYIAIPIIYVISIYLVVKILSKNKYKNNLILPIIAIALYTFVSANRALIIQMLISLFYMIIFLKKKIPQKLKKYLKRICVVLVILIFLITRLKENSVNGKYYNWSIFRSMYSYFSISVPLLDYWSKYIRMKNFHSYGVAFFRAPLNIINMLILQPLGVKFPLLLDTINNINLTDKFIRVFPLHEYNAFATMFYYFYMDFREVGVFIGGIIWGLLCGNIYRNAVDEKDEKSYSFLLFIIYALFKSMVRWEFSSPSFFVAFILLIFVFRKEHIKDDKC